MALPTGVTTCVVTAGAPLDFAGQGGTITLTVTPILGGNATNIVWQATGQPLVNFPMTATADATEQAQVVIPHSDQAGFVNGAGDAFSGWSYRAQIVFKGANRQQVAWTKVFQIPSGQAQIDLDLVPDGSITSPTTAPIEPVTSVNGQTGAVTVEGATDAGVAQIVTQPLTQAALDRAYVPDSREASAHQSYRSPRPKGLLDLTGILTPAPDPYSRTDGVTAAVGFDASWLVVGEDGQHHVISKMDLSTYRADRTPDYRQASPWHVGMITKVSGWSAKDTPNAFMRSCAAESWTYTDPGVHITVTTGYAISVGSGDKNGTTYNPPFVTFWREGASAAQSLTSMLDAAGIMGGDYSTPRCLQGVGRGDTDTFYLCGSGINQSTNPDPSRPTFGKMALTLDAAKDQTGPTKVTSLTWTDHLGALQAAMPAGETIVNVPAVANELLGSILYVVVTTQDSSTVLRSRLVQFDHAAGTAALDAGVDVLTAAAVWPLTPSSGVTNQNASIAVGSGGICVTIVGAGQSYAYFRGTAETKWRNVTNQANRAIGVTGVSGVSWDSGLSRFVVMSSTGAGWMDSLCKRGHPYSDALPAPLRFPGDSAAGRPILGAYGDEEGALILGARQLLMFIPVSEQSPTRVLWGLRVTPSTANDAVTVSEGEAVIYGRTGTTRVYYPGGEVTSLTQTVPVTVVLTSAGVAQRPGNGYKSGTDYPDPALYNQVILAELTRAAAGTPVKASEISLANRDQ